MDAGLELGVTSLGRLSSRGCWWGPGAQAGTPETPGKRKQMLILRRNV